MNEYKKQNLSQKKCRSRDAYVRRMKKIDIARGKKLRKRSEMTWMNVIKNNMKLLKIEEKMVVDKNIRGE